MGLLPDWQIKRDIKIEPFADEALRPGAVSYGLSSYGYDVRVGRKFKVFTNVYGAVIDPKQFDPSAFVDIEGDYCIIPPNSFALAETVEHFEIPLTDLPFGDEGADAAMRARDTGIAPELLVHQHCDGSVEVVVGAETVGNADHPIGPIAILLLHFVADR